MLSRYDFDSQCRKISQLFSTTPWEGMHIRRWRWKEQNGTGYLCLGPVLRGAAAEIPSCNKFGLRAAEHGTLPVETRGLSEWEFSVVYSVAYGVPVLCFEASTMSGQQLDWREIRLHIAPDIPCSNGDAAAWQQMTREIHPALGLPCIQMHPCKTSEWMSSLLGSGGDKRMYMLLWLAAVSNLIGEECPPEFFQTCRRHLALINEESIK
jgi:hypothetical protein